ncbi:hypothetical protein J0H58_36425 [bacterium]|nr:hypothetical protein [bacterium]
MGGIKSALAAAVSRLAGPLGLTVVPTWRLRDLEYQGVPTFRFGGAEYPHLLHHHNCGRLPESATERTVELPLADRWLAHAPADRVVEVGAVTPYYWPGRVRRVADPADPHPQVTDRVGVEHLDLTGAAVLCVSTLEHIGSGEYGLPPDPPALARAVEKLCREAAAFLVTVPVGYSPHADAVFLAPPPPGVTAGYLVRPGRRRGWVEVPAPAQARLPYNPPAATAADPRGANAVVVWERGGFLAAPPPPAGGA